jgi:hypothetical protein
MKPDGWDWNVLVDDFKIWKEDFNSPDGFGSGVNMNVWIQSQIPIISNWTKLLVDKRERGDHLGRDSMM